ncbi:MAG: NAD(P)-dependent oxidoreductase [Bacteroidales bacterium]|jgi:nucleoside-diphosphate-sugar epimerase|nr:NAD(P)-dependent oxidoreductase [Bacteroidales bacterium]
MHKIILTGATSYTGKAICKHLLDNGNIVYAVTRKDSQRTQSLLAHPNLKILYADISNYSQLLKQIDNADAFIHHAWAGVKSDWNNPEIHEQNIKGSQDALEVAKRLNCKAFLQAGSQAEYGNTDGSLITEEHICNPTTEYGKAKLKTALNGLEKVGQLKFAHYRIFSIYGHGDHSYTMIATALEKMRKNETVELATDGTQLWNYLLVDDFGEKVGLLAEAMLNSSTANEYGIFNMASDDTRPLKSYMEEMKTALNSKSPLLFGDQKSAIQLNPSIEKLKQYIRNPAFTPFAEGIVAMNLRMEQR